MKIDLTGNPFVDTGLFVISSLAGHDNPALLTLADVKRIHADGRSLAKNNARLKSFTMVFGTNGPLTQSGYRPAGKKKETSEKNIKAYTGVLKAILEAVETQDPSYPLCEVCGCRHTFDFDAVVRRALSSAGVSDLGAKTIGREWFPLAGSLGNDAQALPGASRGLDICALCLFAVHYMPLALMLMQGRLVCFQSNDARVAMSLTDQIMDGYKKELAASSGKVEMQGRKEGTAAVARQLLQWMEERRKAEKATGLGQSVGLTAWLFTNAGPDADCEIVEIPNAALQFLDQISKKGLVNELGALLNRDSKTPEHQFLNCVLERRDYSGLYPFKAFPGADPRLFALYQQRVVGIHHRALATAHRLASTQLGLLSPKDRKAVKKAGYLTGDAGKQSRQSIKRQMIVLAQTEGFSLSDYDQLFPTTQYTPIRTAYRGWQTLGYYFVNSEVHVPDFLGAQPISHNNNMKGTHPKIKLMAKLYFDDYIGKRGEAVFEKQILGSQGRPAKSPKAWLSDVFFLLASKHEGFTKDDWDELAQDEAGRADLVELVFQLRLELANLFRESRLQKQDSNK
jgi:CRISPR-associated protein Cst1